MKKQSEKEPEKNSVLQSMCYTIQMIWGGDKWCVIYTFFKNCTEEVFGAFLFIYLTQLLYTFIEKGVPYSRLIRVITIFCLLHILIHLSSAGHAFYIRYKKPKVYEYVFSKVISQAKKIELTKYEQPEFYDRFSRALDECLTKSFDGLLGMAYAIGCFLGTLASAGLIITVDYRILFFVIPPVVASLYYGSKQNQQEMELRTEETRTKRIMEYVKRVFYEKKYASELRLYSMARLLLKKQKEAYEARFVIHKKHRKKIAMYQFMQSVVFLGLTFLCSYFYITYCIKVQGILKVGAYVAMISAVDATTWSIRRGIEKMVEAGTNCMYMNYLKEFLEYKPSEKQHGERVIAGKLGDIQFDHVSFTYQGAKEEVLHDVSFSIKKGEKIALVGENGAGKTTLIKLLMGLYPVDQGRILAEGIPIHELQPEEYLKHFGTVFQDLQVFALPLCENVLMREPKDEAERQLVVDSLEKAQFGDTLATMKQGIDTMITKEFDDKGFVCSGGQAQKIAIARVFAKDPDVVILDEPSSALDPIAEYNMYHNMLEVSEGKTVIFISHRLSSARMADKVYLLEHGRIAEQGSHDQLMECGGKYAEMFELQAQNYREGKRDV